MKIAVDTNILLRVVLDDDPEQRQIALRCLKRATAVVLPIVALCEAAWVLKRTYGLGNEAIAGMLQLLTEIEAAEYDLEAVEAGLAMLSRGGDFADGVIAQQDRQRGAETLLSFDRKAVARLGDLGVDAYEPQDFVG